MEVTSTTHLEQQAAELETISVRLGWLERRRLAQELETFGLTLPQYMALRCIRASRVEVAGESGCSMTELAESTQQLTATMTGIIDRLVERGLVVRARDLRDRRALRVLLTPAGEDLMERVSQHKRAGLSGLLAQLPAEERRMVIDAARRYLLVVESALNNASNLPSAKDGSQES